MNKLLTANGCWVGLLEAGCLRAIEVKSVNKVLACGTSILGVKRYTCGNGYCPRAEYLCNTSHSRACPSCGRKAADQWIAFQHNGLYDCAW